MIEKIVPKVAGANGSDDEKALADRDFRVRLGADRAELALRQDDTTPFDDDVACRDFRAREAAMPCGTRAAHLDARIEPGFRAILTIHDPSLRSPQMLEGVARARNAHDVALVPTSVKEKRPFGEARAFARTFVELLDGGRIAHLTHTLLARHERPDAVAFPRDPLGGRHGEAALGAERLGLGKLAREPAAEQPFATPLT